MKLELENLSVGYGKKEVLANFSLEVSGGEVICLLGPNGVGKTTVFRTLLGFQKPLAGRILIDGMERETLSQKEFARLIGYVPQSHQPPFAFTVKDVVVMGRLAHLKRFASPSAGDYELAAAALKDLGISHLADSVYTNISGGERQMVLIARALTQQPCFLVMDEPTANLDFGNQICVLSCISKLATDGIGVLMTTHNPDHAFLCSTRAVLISRNKTICAGSADEVLTEQSLREAYGVDVILATAERCGRTVRTCVPAIF